MQLTFLGSIALALASVIATNSAANAQTHDMTAPPASPSTMTPPAPGALDAKPMAHDGMMNDCAQMHADMRAQIDALRADIAALRADLARARTQ
jgi:hypothetical protein